jgi:biotin operon repressor
MRYRKSLEIEQRLAEALQLIETGEYSTPMLAERLGVSIPTVSRYVTALRERGYDIKALKAAKGWRFVMASKPAARPKPKQTSGLHERDDTTLGAGIVHSLRDNFSDETRATAEQSGVPKG